MPNVSPAAGFRGAAIISFSLIANTIASAPVSGQAFSGSPYDQSRAFGYSTRGLIELEESASAVPDSWEPAPLGAATVSAEALRHPLSSRARRRLEKALHLAELGKHLDAIKELRETLIKEPSAAAYTHNLMGVEYAESGQFDEARNSFQEAVRLMPRESINHSNLGFSLAVAGDFHSAEQEARTAIQLDSSNTRAKKLLELMLHRDKIRKR